MNVSVIIPFKPDSLERVEALAWVSRMWAETECQVIVARDVPDGPMCKARAVDHGIEQADGDTIIVADADVWCSPVHINRAIANLGKWYTWGVPHRRILRFNADYSRRLCDLGEEPTFVGEAVLEEPPYTGLQAAGGIVVLRRETWNRVPMDPRFLGWGFEDVAWWRALRTLEGTWWRGKADLWHLWHPRQDAHPDRTMRGIEGNPANRMLYQRYRDAYLRPAPMQEVINEARTALDAAAMAWPRSAGSPDH